MDGLLLRMKMERMSRTVHLIPLLTPLVECESIERMHVIGLLLSTRLGNETVDDTVPIFSSRILINVPFACGKIWCI